MACCISVLHIFKYHSFCTISIQIAISCSTEVIFFLSTEHEKLWKLSTCKSLTLTECNVQHVLRMLSERHTRIIQLNQSPTVQRSNYSTTNYDVRLTYRRRQLRLRLQSFRPFFERLHSAATISTTEATKTKNRQFVHRLQTCTLFSPYMLSTPERVLTRKTCTRPF